MSVKFPEQVQTALVELCQLFSACLKRYALQCSDDGRFAQLIFAADLTRACRSTSEGTAPAIRQILSRHLVAFEEQCGTFGKALTFFLRDAFDERNFRSMNFVERRKLLAELHDDLLALNDDDQFERIERLETPILVEHVLNTLPKEIFDRKGNYQRLLVELLEGQFDRLDDYLTYHRELSFVTLGSSIDQSCLIDGVLVPVANNEKILPSFHSKTSVTLVFLDLTSTEASPFTVVDDEQRFFSFDTSIYRRFVAKHLQNVDLILSAGLIDSSFLFELHRANISVIDTLEERTLAFLLEVYRCLPCNRLILFDDETIDQRTTKLLDGHVRIDQQIYIYLSSNGRHQTLLTSVPTPTLVLTTEKILINLLRLLKFLRERTKNCSSSSLAVATEIDFLRHVDRHAVRWRNFLVARRIHLDRTSSSTVQLRLPVCLFREYLLNAVRFLDFIHKIDGVFSTKVRVQSDQSKLQQQ